MRNRHRPSLLLPRQLSRQGRSVSTRTPTHMPRRQQRCTLDETVSEARSGARPQYWGYSRFFAEHPKSGGCRGRVEAVPKRGAAARGSANDASPKISRNRGEHPEFDARESRVLRDRTPTRQVGTPPVQPRSRPRGRGERSYPAAGPRAPATTGAGCARSLGSVRQRSNAVTHRWGIPPGGKYPHVPS